MNQQAMKEALMSWRSGRAIVCDYAGFRTLDSVRRAQAVFNCQQLTIVSQPGHNQRALYLASITASMRLPFMQRSPFWPGLEDQYARNPCQTCMLLDSG